MPDNPLKGIVLEMAALLKTRELDLEAIRQRQIENRKGRDDIATQFSRRPRPVNRAN